MHLRISSLAGALPRVAQPQFRLSTPAPVGGEAIPGADSATDVNAVSRAPSAPPSSVTPLSFAKWKERAAAAVKEAGEKEEGLRYSVPAGETGQGGIDHADERNSLLRLFAFESQHAAAHRTRLPLGERGAGQPNIRIKTGLDEGGQVVAVAGATETEADFDGDGTSEEWRELAYLSDARRLIAAGGSSLFGLSSRPLPLLRHSGTAASAYRALQNRGDILRFSTLADGPAIVRSLKRERIAGLVNAFEPIERSLADLRDTLRSLSGESALAGVKATVESDALSARVTGRDASPGAYGVRVESLAAAHTVESSFYYPTTPYEENALGLSGRFTLNGVSIEVEAADTISDLAEKISWGEDANHNGRLDTGRSVYPEEDDDGDGVLDGGTQQHGVTARVLAGRLRLTAAEGPEAMQVTDPNGILMDLGILMLDNEGHEVFAREIASPAGSVLSIDGCTSHHDGNTVAGAIPGVELVLRAVTDNATVRVAADGGSFAAELERLVASFNDAMKSLNNALLPGQGILQGVAQVAQVKIRLRNGSTAEVPGQPESMRYAEQAGVTPRAGTRIAFTGAQLDQGLLELRKAMALRAGAERPSAGVLANRDLKPLQRQRTLPSVYNALSTLGITSAEDDTLVFDREKLLAAVEENLETVRRLFGKEDGYVARLAATVEDAVAEGRGLLPMAKQTLQALAQQEIRQTLQQSLTRAALDALSPAAVLPHSIA